MNYTETLARFAATTTIDQIPEYARDAGKRLIKDTIACAIAGAQIPSSVIVNEVIGDFGGRPEATVWVTGQKLPCALAAHINGHFSNAVDSDDTLHYKAHIAAAVVAPALAVAEREGSSGADFLLASILGYEVAGRVAMSMKSLRVAPDGQLKFGLVSGYSSVVFGAVVAAGRLLGLDADQMRMAFGIAAAAAPLPASSQFGMDLPRPMTKYALYGTLSEAGVTAALLARKGFTAEASVLDGERGFWRVAGSADSNWDALADGLGTRWLVDEVIYKPYPACRFLNSSIDMYYSIVTANQLRPDEIESITARVHGGAISKHMGDPTVETTVDGMFSLPYLLAAATYQGEPGPQWHSAAAHADPRMKAFAAKVSVELEPASAAAAKEDLDTYRHNRRMPATVELVARGTTFTERRDYAHGDPYDDSVRFTDADVNEKFRRYCTAALGVANVSALIEYLDTTDKHSSVAELASLLA